METLQQVWQQPSQGKDKEQEQEQKHSICAFLLITRWDRIEKNDKGTFRGALTFLAARIGKSNKLSPEIKPFFLKSITNSLKLVTNRSFFAKYFED